MLNVVSHDVQVLQAYACLLSLFGNHPSFSRLLLFSSRCFFRRAQYFLSLSFAFAKFKKSDIGSNAEEILMFVVLSPYLRFAGAVNRKKNNEKAVKPRDNEMTPNDLN